MPQLVTILNFILEVPDLFFAEVILWLRSASAKYRSRNSNTTELFLPVL